MDRYNEALQLATVAHNGQTRKNSTEPYIEHPKRVAATLQKAGFREEVVMAGLLHDVVEDIREKFGADVADIVAYHTEDKTLSWEDRKQHTIDSLKVAPFDVKALIIADKLDNLQSIKEQHDVMGEKVWDAFKRDREQQSWYNRSVMEALGENQDEPEFFQEYRKLVNEFYPK